MARTKPPRLSWEPDRTCRVFIAGAGSLEASMVVHPHGIAWCVFVHPVCHLAGHTIRGKGFVLGDTMGDLARAAGEATSAVFGGGAHA